LSVEAFQASEIVTEDLPVTRRLPGTVGGWVSGPPPVGVGVGEAVGLPVGVLVGVPVGPPPAHGPPLTVQLIGGFGPAPIQPKLAVPPGLIVLFQVPVKV